MRVYGIPGEGEAPTFLEVDEPRPNAGDVLVEVHASSVNPHDAAVASGAASRYLEYRYPVVLGSDLAGVVVGLGDGVTDLRIGDRVFGLVRELVAERGTFAPRVAVPRATVASTPAGVDDETAGALGVATLTALRCSDALELAPGDPVIVNGASGGVGSSLVQLLSRRGAHVIATARPGDEGLLRGWGAAEVVDWTTTGLPRARALVDLVTGDPAALRSIADAALPADGVIVSTRHVAAAARPGLGVDIRAQADAEALRRMAELLGSGWRSTVTAHFAFDEIPAALAALDSGVRGKVAIAIA
jgi:NADPH:quinone reductase-like Zn-dependent oxidoreductase